MSNKTIVKRMIESRDRFTCKEIALSELGSSIEAHGNALEGLGSDWQDLLLNFSGECEYIVEMNFPKTHHDKGIIVMSKLLLFLKNNHPELFIDETND